MGKHVYIVTIIGFVLLSLLINDLSGRCTESPVEPIWERLFLIGIRWRLNLQIISSLN